MIPKGNQRGGGQALATHLLNAFDNDSVAVVDVRGAIAQDLHGAFAEWYAESKATKCKKYLYSLSINPDHRQGPFNRGHYDDFIRRTEASLGLSDLPRVIVFHVKHGREHCHVVWSRIDTEELKAAQLSHDHQKLRAVAQEYARDHGLTLPPGMRNNNGNKRYANRAQNENLAEKQQEERTGVSEKQRTEQIMQIWRATADGRSFVGALEAAGYYLAAGDKRSHVVVDIYGEVYSLSRQLPGVKRQERLARLAAYPVDKLLDVASMQDQVREKRQALLLQRQKTDDPNVPWTKESAQQRRNELSKAHDLRRDALDAKQQQMRDRHAAERKALADLQNARSADIVSDRAAKQPKGVMAFLARITGFNAVTAFRQTLQDRKRQGDYRLQTAALLRRHRRETQDFKRHYSALTGLEKRERRSLETSVRRETFRSIAAPAKARTPAPELTPAQRARADKTKQIAEEFRRAATARTRPSGSGRQEVTPEQLAKLAAFKRTAGKLTEPSQEAQSAATGSVKKEKISPQFNEAAGTGRAASPDALSDKFNEKAEKPVPAQAGEQGLEKKQIPPPEKPTSKEPRDQRLQEIKENAADLTKAQREVLDLSKEFRKQAGPPSRDKDPDREKHYRRQPQDYSIRR